MSNNIVDPDTLQFMDENNKPWVEAWKKLVKGGIV